MSSTVSAVDIKPPFTVKAINAIAISAAVINAIGTPLNACGTSVSSNLSLMLDMRTNASRKPIPAANPCTMLPRKLNSFVMLSKATPKIAQFVVIKGRYIPKASYKLVIFFLRKSSTSCTKVAITSMNATVWR